MTKRFFGLTVVAMVMGLASPAWATLALTVDPISLGSVHVDNTGTGSCTTCTATIAASVTASMAPTETYTSIALTGISGSSDLDCSSQVTFNPSSQTVSSSVASSMNIIYKPIKRGNLNCLATFKNGATSDGTFTLSATGLAPAITVAATTNFGSARVNNSALTSTSNTLSVMVSNTGNADLTLGSLNQTGSTDYMVSGTIPAVIVAGGTASFSVTFDPTAAGSPITGNLQFIGSDASATGDLAISASNALTGIGTTAVITVPANLNFNTVANGTPSTKSISVSNTGAAPKGPLTLTSATITPTTSGSTWFTFAANGASACNGNTSCTFNSVINGSAQNVDVVCNPNPSTISGTQTATVAFTSDTDAGGTTVTTLSCTAGRPDVSITTTAIAFGDQRVGAASAAMPLGITNSGNIATNYALVKSGTNSADFAIGGPGCASSGSIGAGVTLACTVTFTPSSLGPRAVSLTLTTADPDPGDDTRIISLTGNGVEPQISTVATLDFGTIDIGSSSGTKTLTVTNTGTQDLVISSATIDVGGTVYSQLTGMATTITPGSNTAFTFTCSPTAQGANAGNFKIVSNSFTNATTNVGFTCNGQRGVLVGNPLAIDFGPVPMNMLVQRNLTISNTGNLAITGLTATLSSATQGYSIDATTPVNATIAAGGNQVLKIDFLPPDGSAGGPATITFNGTWTGVAAHAVQIIVTLNGDGLTADVNLSPMAIDYGSFRWDAPQSKTLCIINGSEAAVKVIDIAINPMVGTMAGEFTRGTMKLEPGGCGVATGSSTVNTLSPAPSLATNAALEVTFIATPAARIGTLGATVMVTTDLVVNPIKTATLMGTSTSGIVMISQPTLDLGPVDVDTGPANATVTVTNMGTATLDLGTFTKVQSDASLTITLPGAQMLAPGASAQVMVAYDPSIVAASTAMISFPVTHLVTGALTGQIMISGRGIDRLFKVTPDAEGVTFAPTFKNPGTMATTADVTVSNAGEAPLHITNVTVTPSVYTLAAGGTAVDIPGNGSHVFKVAFTPTVVGAAPPGLITFMQDDDQRVMAAVTLNGLGIGRQVTMDPMTTIDLGYTGVGVPVTITDALRVTSMDAVHTFKIKKITLDQDLPFTIDNTPTDAGVDLGPAESKSFDITFSADTPGVFTTTATLFLDEDPDAQAMVTLQGHAEFVDLHGSGGCSTSGQNLDGGAVLVLGAIGLGIGRRRRRKQQLASVALAAGALLVAPRAFADGSPGDLDVGVFNPTPATTVGGFQLVSPEVGANGDWVAGGVVSYASNPLVAQSELGTAKLIGQRTMFDIGGAYAFLDRFEAGARMPLYSQSGDLSGNSHPLQGFEAAKGTARGDLSVFGKARLVDTNFVTLGIGLQVTLPTATSGQYTGTDMPEVTALALGAFVPHPRLTVTANVGGIVRKKVEAANISQGSGLQWGGGVAFRALDKLWIAAEVFGELMPSGHKTQKTDGSNMVSTTGLSPVEGLLGINYRLERRLTVGLAAGRGLSSGLGAPDLRGVFAITFAPGTPELRPIHPPPPPHIDGDADGDGILDSKDKCPNEAEDKDGFEDDDGCPDLDNDHDGIPDAKDKCPLDPEDKDGFQDDDGCPDKDNDNDGIPDDKDKCPNQPEDKDGFQDLDGCPDPDNDHDGIPDAQDKCPNEPETINGIQDDDGCPDKGDSVVVVSPDRLETLEAIQFNGTKINKASFNVLGQVAATLRAHPEIIRVRVTTHVQPTTNVAKDQETTEKRATVVRDWLIQWGIAASRVEARGFGGTKPLVPSTQSGAAQVNDRLELIILERK